MWHVKGIIATSLQVGSTLVFPTDQRLLCTCMSSNDILYSSWAYGLLVSSREKGKMPSSFHRDLITLGHIDSCIPSTWEKTALISQGTSCLHVGLSVEGICVWIPPTRSSKRHIAFKKFAANFKQSKCLIASWETIIRSIVIIQIMRWLFKTVAQWGTKRHKIIYKYYW